MSSFAIEETVDALRERLRGALLSPDDEGFEEATRLWNGIDRLVEVKETYDPDNLLRSNRNIRPTRPPRPRPRHAPRPRTPDRS